MEHVASEDDRELVLRIIKFVKRKHRVTLTQIQQALDLDPTDFRYLVHSLAKKRGDQTDNPNHILTFVNQPQGNIQIGNMSLQDDEFQLVPTAVFSYVDYLEIVEARRAASEARQFALMATWISIGSLIIGTMVGLLGIVVQLLLQ